MAVYSITSTAAEETALTAVVARTNAERAAQTPPLGAVTNAQYLAARAKSMLQDYVRQQREDEAPTLREAYLAASDAVRAQIRTALGV